jgi:hypothetical protein
MIDMNRDDLFTKYFLHYFVLTFIYRYTDATLHNSLETPKRKGKLNIHVEALLRESPRDDDDNTNAEVLKDDYVAMRMSMAPPKDGSHHFTGTIKDNDDGDDDDDDDDMDNYVVMEVKAGDE